MAEGRKFGTFGGVYVPSLLTILGVIMYMRLGWVVGNSGTLFTVLAIIIMAHIVSVSTGLSVSSVATDKKVEAGGIYYMLSRSLGFPIGGAIGVTLFVATALSIALYLIGFSESLCDVMGIDITINQLRFYGSLALIGIVTIAFISTSIAIKTQYFILGAIGLSLISVFFGTAEGKGFDTGEVVDKGINFAALFGVFFPAVTGFTAGIAMSGDLKDPKKSIPWGTMLAITTGLVVYVLLAIFMYSVIPHAELQRNYNVLVQFGLVPALVIAGIWGATLSSALGGILGGPRILQAMSLDGITPKIFAKGVGKDNEPRNALILTFILAESGILIGELDVIAEVVAMFYMAAYLFINLSCFLEQWASPDFRPSFKVHISIPLVGAIVTFLLMIQLNLVAALVSVLIMTIIFIWLTRRRLELASGDVWHSVWSTVVKTGLKRLDQKKVHKRNWQPNMLLFSGGSEVRPYLVEFSKDIAGKTGMISNFELIENTSAEVLLPKNRQSQSNDIYNDDGVFYRKQEVQNVFKGIEVIAQTYGFSGVEPNTVLMGWARNTKDPIWFAQMTKKLEKLDYNVLYLDFDKERGWGQKKRIDIWITKINEATDLMLHLGKLLKNSLDWNNAEVKVVYLNHTNSQQRVIEKIILEKLSNLRTSIDIQVLNNELEQKPFYELVKLHSYDADLIMVEIPNITQQEKEFVQSTNDFLNVMGTTLLVRASSHFNDVTVLDKEVEEIYEKIEIIPEKTVVPTINLRKTSCEGFNTLIGQVDSDIVETNALFVNEVTTALKTVYSGLVAAFLQKMSSEKMSPFLALEFVLNDFNENRIHGVGDVLQNGIGKSINRLGKTLDNLPKNFERSYSIDELKIKESDPPKLVRRKKKIAKTNKLDFPLRKYAQEQFESAYLIQFEKSLNVIGLSGFVLVRNLKKWIEDGGDQAQLEAVVQRTIESEKEIIANTFTNLSRKYCNSIIAKTTVNSKWLRYQVQLDDWEESHSQAKINKYLQKIVSYGKNWVTNQQYFISQLMLLVELEQLKRRIIPVVKRSVIVYKQKLVKKSLLTFDDIHKNVDDIKHLEEVISDIHQLIESIDVEEEIQKIQQKFSTFIREIFNEFEVMKIEDINNFENNQFDIDPISIDSARIVEYIIDDDIILPMKNKYLQFTSNIRSELVKVMNDLKLFLLTHTNENSDDGTINDIKKKLDRTILNAKERFVFFDENIEKELIVWIKKVDSVFTDNEVIVKAGKFNGVLNRDSVKKGIFKQVKLINNLITASNSKIANWIEKGQDLLVQNNFESQTKIFQNDQEKWSAVVSKFYNPTIEKLLPFYYLQLFTTKQSAPSVPLKNREREIERIKSAYQRFVNGTSGALMVTGEPLSGKSYLIDNFIRWSKVDETIEIKPQTINSNLPTSIEKELLENHSAQLFSDLPENSIVYLNDLELWWSRSEEGNNNLKKLLNVIKENHEHVFFVMESNQYFFDHAKKYLGVESCLLSTVVCSPFKINELQSAILERHQAGGLTFVYKGKLETELKTRELTSIFKRIAYWSNGNIGIANYYWCSLVDNIENNTIYLKKTEGNKLPEVNQPLWEIILSQLIMHKAMTFEKLIDVFRETDKQIMNEALQSLIRSGVVQENNLKYVVSPWSLKVVSDYLKSKKLLL